jgi:nitrate reductase gamma subunit
MKKKVAIVIVGIGVFVAIKALYAFIKRRAYQV